MEQDLRQNLSIIMKNELQRFPEFAGGKHIRKHWKFTGLQRFLTTLEIIHSFHGLL
jgi:hypothetical protein